jgi:hypothetical protein
MFKSPYTYFHRCLLSGSDEHLEQTWKLIGEQLYADGWLRLDDSAAKSPNLDRLMYFALPPAEYKPA